MCYFNSDTDQMPLIKKIKGDLSCLLRRIRSGFPVNKTLFLINDNSQCLLGIRYVSDTVIRALPE